MIYSDRFWKETWHLVGSRVLENIDHFPLRINLGSKTALDRIDLLGVVVIAFAMNSMECESCRGPTRPCG